MTYASTSLRQIPVIAYFSMEIGLDPAMPTYSGGLGVLAGDTLRSAADLGLPMIGVTLLHRKGYFHQHLDSRGEQTEEQELWKPEDFLELLPIRAEINIEGRAVQLQSWRHDVSGVHGHTVPVYFLDTDLPENDQWDRSLAGFLYGGGARYRLCQEAVLGLGGVAMLRALGLDDIEWYHMNEGHSALLALALLEEQARESTVNECRDSDAESVRRRCVFTTHTPVPAGMDQFPLTLVRDVLGETHTRSLEAFECCLDDTLNMTYLALRFSHYINGVSMRHEEIAHTMFPNYPINAITNGVHAMTWTSSPFQRVFDKHIPQWRRDNLYLRYAISIPLSEIQQAHYDAKRELLEEVERRTGVKLDQKKMTIGFARRATAYKRADFLFSDLDRLEKIANEVGPYQLVLGGKAHPHDEDGKAIIKRIFEATVELRDIVPVVYLEEYEMDLAKLLSSGVDLWLNTPQKPQEASGTSGMKAALNGVPSFSILDGWWIEGCLEGLTGWSIGESWQSDGDPKVELASLYDKLEYIILPMFYERPADFAQVMRSVIAINGSYFNTQRMLFQYLENAYLDSAAIRG